MTSSSEKEEEGARPGERLPETEDTNMADAANEDTSGYSAEELRSRAEDCKIVQFKGPPPDLDDCENYTLWKRKLKLWKKATCLSDTQQAAILMQSIRDDQKIKKGLSTLMLQTMEDSELDNPTMENVEKFLDDQLDIDEYGEIWRTFRVLMTCEIKPGEKHQEFTARFEKLFEYI